MADPNEARVSNEEQLQAASAAVAEDAAGSGIAAGEVRVVAAPPKPRSRSPLLPLLLLVLFLVGGYALLQNGSLSGNGQPAAPAKHYPIERAVVEAEVATPPATGSAQNQPVVPPAPQAEETPEVAAGSPAVEESAPAEPVATAAPAVPVGPQYQVLVGPFLHKSTLAAARQRLSELGLKAEVGRGRGPISMTRLLEGVYSKRQGRERLKQIKQRAGDAFLMASGDKLALYVGSFTDPQRAADYARTLAKQGLSVSPISSDVVVRGKMLLTAPGTQAQAQAQEVADRLAAAGLSVQLKRVSP